MQLASLVALGVFVMTASVPPEDMNAQSTSAQKSFQLDSSGFKYGATIPRQFACDGEDVSPHLHWSDPPAGTVTYALVMDDPDAPSGTWVHWVIWNIGGGHGVVENFPRTSELPEGARQGRNDFGKIGYNGPCPPPGKTHRYFFRVYAVDIKLDLPAGATRAKLDSALKGHILAEAEYMGTYRRWPSVLRPCGLSPIQPALDCR